jgi:hypothetical protein
MHHLRFTVLAVLLVAGCSSSDSSSSGTTDEHGCAPGATYCHGCNGSGFCSMGGCPGFQCAEPIADGSAGAGGSSESDAAGSTDAMGGSDFSDASRVDSGPSACGAQTCGANQLCVHPTCQGGAAVPCSPPSDAGTCPNGWTYQAVCQFGGMQSGPGCLPPRCTDPPPFCIDIPAACGTMPKCSCLPGDVCQGHGGCGFISNGKDVLCLGA